MERYCMALLVLLQHGYFMYACLLFTVAHLHSMCQRVLWIPRTTGSCRSRHPGLNDQGSSIINISR